MAESCNLQRGHDLADLIISHDLRVVRALAHQILVMREGRALEQGPADNIFDNPQDPYTKILFSAAFDLKAAPLVKKTANQIEKETNEHRTSK